jgi:hypothetical protein
MQIDDRGAERMGASLKALNARIARLAMALDIALDDQASLQSLVASSQVKPFPVERRDSSQGAAEAKVYVGPERRKAHQREELRGLLTLRYQLEASSVNEHGLALTRQVLADAQDHLVRQGFKPGADGLGLDELFKAP